MQKIEKNSESTLITRAFKIKTRKAFKGGYPYGINAKVLDAFENKVASVSGAGFDMKGYLVSETLTSVFKEEIAKSLKNLLNTDRTLAENVETILFPQQGTKLGISLDQVIDSAKKLGFYISFDSDKAFKISFNM